MPLLGFYRGDRRNNPIGIFISFSKLLLKIKPIMPMPHHVKNLTLKFNARKMCLFRTDILPYKKEKKNLSSLHVALLTLVAGSSEPIAQIQLSFALGSWQNGLPSSSRFCTALNFLRGDFAAYVFYCRLPQFFFGNNDEH